VSRWKRPVGEEEFGPIRECFLHFCVFFGRDLRKFPALLTPEFRRMPRAAFNAGDYAKVCTFVSLRHNLKPPEMMPNCLMCSYTNHSDHYNQPPPPLKRAEPSQEDRNTRKTNKNR
jgi:hypothetical protein